MREPIRTFPGTPALAATLLFVCVGTHFAPLAHAQSYEIGVKYDDSSWGSIRQSAAPSFRIGDRVLVTDLGLESLH